MNKPASAGYLHPARWHSRFVLGSLVLDLSLRRREDVQCSALPRVQNCLAALCREYGISRLELARILDVRPATLEAMECGSYMPSLALALRISAFFAVPVETIFSYI